MRGHRQFAEGARDYVVRMGAFLAFLLSASAASAAAGLTQEWFGVSPPVMFAAFAGATCALAMLPTIPTRRQMFISVLVGTLVGTYAVQLLPFLIGMIGLTELAQAMRTTNALHLSAAFFLGAFGHSLLSLGFTNGLDRLRKLIGGNP